jgi:hypothetical protein
MLAIVLFIFGPTPGVRCHAWMSPGTLKIMIGD